MGVSNAYGSYGSYRSSLGILKFFANGGHWPLVPLNTFRASARSGLDVAGPRCHWWPFATCATRYLLYRHLPSEVQAGLRRPYWMIDISNTFPQTMRLINKERQLTHDIPGYLTKTRSHVKNPRKSTAIGERAYPQKETQFIGPSAICLPYASPATHQTIPIPLTCFL